MRLNNVPFAIRSVVMSRRESLEHYLALAYPYRVLADPDGGYVAVFPDLPGCMTQAETLEEIGPMAVDARRGWIETAYEAGQDIPLPSHSGETLEEGNPLVRFAGALTGVYEADELER
jgi:antitoxin HicB